MANELNVPDPLRTADLESLRLEVNRNLGFSPDEDFGSPLDPQLWDFAMDAEIRIRTLSPVSTPTWVVAVDSSSIPVFEGENGTIYAVRAASVGSYGGSPRSYIKLGPYFFRIGKERIRKLVTARYAVSLLPEKVLAQRFLRTRIERAVQLFFLREIQEGVLLVDGSLKPSYLESREAGIESLLRIAREGKNSVLGISKSSALPYITKLAAALYNAKRVPAYLPIGNILTKDVPDILGNPVLARFSADGIPFRIDVAGEVMDALGVLIHNDSFRLGYPDSLRLAHHLAAFSPYEELCLQGCLGLTSYNTSSIFTTRKMALGLVL